MSKMLYVQASPRGANSRSVAVANAYLNAYLEAHPDTSVEILELWQAGLPEFDGNRVEAKLKVFGGQSPEGTEKTLWDEIVRISTHFAAADHYLFAVPMWNGGIPYKLKQYIDIVHQPGVTFGFDPAIGYIGLLASKRATLVYTSGAFSQSAPSPAYGVDHQSTYLRAWLNEAGVTEIEEVRYQPTLVTADPEGGLAAALEAAAALGSST